MKQLLDRRVGQAQEEIDSQLGGVNEKVDTVQESSQSAMRAIKRQVNYVEGKLVNYAYA